MAKGNHEYLMGLKQTNVLDIKQLKGRLHHFWCFGCFYIILFLMYSKANIQILVQIDVLVS